MATATPTKPATRTPTHSPLALWHLLSLDAPTVAALWTWFIARANHLQLPLSATVAMGLAVWMLYAADRLLDAQSTHHDPLEARHLFHHRHHTAFLIGIFAATNTSNSPGSSSPALTWSVMMPRARSRGRARL